ncbi:MAG TPA: SBBP repeat-containing protein, partial [Candidatus Acidoferrales bacterium]|nr:SBBP repeat-containing protein [Candidatus Acidoferrales bacterium]
MMLLKLARALFLLAGMALASDEKAMGLRFEPNVGQAGREVWFLSRWPGHTLFLTSTGATLRTETSVWKMNFIGAKPAAAAAGLDRMESPSHYLIGGREGWHPGVQPYGRVEYRDLYPGVNLVYSGDRDHLAYEFVIHPGADPSQITVGFEGGAPVLLGSGELAVRNAQEQWRHVNPQAYQLRNGTRAKVAVQFQSAGPNEVKLAVGHHDLMQALVITYSTYLGGSGQDTATSIVADAVGNTYVTGWTESTDFPEAAGTREGKLGSVDVYVAKLGPAGNLLYVTYLGGSGDDRGFGIGVDNAGSAIVTGWTYSTNFPTVNAAQSTPGGGRDGFVAKLNPAGSALVFGTYLGGIGADSANAVALDSQGNIYVAGETTSANLPVLNPYQAQNGGGDDAFVFKFSGTGARLYGTFLGGVGDDRATAIAVDGAGYAYLTGSTYSPNFPAVNGYQPRIGGGQDAFASKIGLTGNTLIYSTYLGGSGGTVSAPETGSGIAVDSSGCA